MLAVGEARRAFNPFLEWRSGDDIKLRIGSAGENVPPTIKARKSRNRVFDAGRRQQCISDAFLRTNPVVRARGLGPGGKGNRPANEVGAVEPRNEGHQNGGAGELQYVQPMSPANRLITSMRSTRSPN